ncbi:MAG: methylenetetrahydrofolate reductase [NAD(P)H] [Spirochaetes bacterium]|nr:methylenetetrahydrofolate reductase [NAD(P)H] [Spirochaetota bacterium]
MHIKDIYKNNDLVISMEIFPPKKTTDIETLFKTLSELKNLNPHYVSVTYGAGGSTKDKSVEIAAKVRNEYNIETMAHLTCVQSSPDDLNNILDELKTNNIENILALRGDPPQGQKEYPANPQGFQYAYQLVEHIRNHNHWSIGVAGYPEGHLEAENLEKDIEYLKFKIDRGADFIISQLFFDNEIYYRFIELCEKYHIDIPIVPGIFPILSFQSINRIASLCGASIPDNLSKKLLHYQEDHKAVEEIGIEYAIQQVNELLKFGIPGFHFYTMNKSQQIRNIINSSNI